MLLYYSYSLENVFMGIFLDPGGVYILLQIVGYDNKRGRGVSKL